MKFIIILFGAPGSGKGYLSTRLITACEKYIAKDEIAYISTGDLIREEIKNETATGMQIKELVNSGKLVPDSIVDALVTNAIKGNQRIKILDGYPRTDAQLSVLASQIPDDTRVITLFLDTPMQLILQRVAKRRVCAKCKATHSVDDGCCPICGGESVVRKDDAMINARIEEYRKNTLPLWDKMDTIGAMLRVDGTLPTEEIIDSLINLLFP